MHLRVENSTYHRIFGFILIACWIVTMTWLLTPGILRPKFTGHVQQGPQRFTNNASKARLIVARKLKSLLKCQDNRLTMEMLQQGDYWVLKNLIRGHRSISMNCSESITFTTIGDYTYMDHLENVVIRWLGPISLALFAPGYDFNETMNAIQYARHCLPVSQLIRDYVSFHIYFPNAHMPQDQMPRSEEEALAWPYDCFPLYAPYDNANRSATYRAMENLPYPINVGRNIARKSVNTYFIFGCDIDLYPSLGFIQQFLQMAADNVSSVLGGKRPRVFAVPVFELEENAIVPDNKDDLMTTFEMEMAMPIHERSCTYCIMIPDQDRWLQANVSDKFEVISVAKRYSNNPFWEPFYVSDNSEPEFDERLEWSGLTDKRMQNYAMCLLDYEYHILHPAFLTHYPGIQPFDVKGDRMSYVQNIVESIVPEYWTLYGYNTNCEL